MDIAKLIAEVPANTSAKHSLGKYEMLLDNDTREALNNFVAKLVAEGKTINTANSYKSYVAKALACDLAWSDMSSDVRSAVKSFARLMQ